MFRSERFQEPGGSFAVRGREASVPVAERPREILSKLGEFRDLPVDVRELFLGERANLPAWRLTAIALPVQLLELVEGEADAERALDQENPVDRLRRVGAVAVGETPRLSQKSPAFVVPQRIGADPRPAGDLTGSKLRGELSFLHGCAV
jgi:hypothetical protein